MTFGSASSGCLIASAMAMSEPVPQATPRAPTELDRAREAEPVGRQSTDPYAITPIATDTIEQARVLGAVRDLFGDGKAVVEATYLMGDKRDEAGAVALHYRIRVEAGGLFVDKIDIGDPIEEWKQIAPKSKPVESAIALPAADAATKVYSDFDCLVAKIGSNLLVIETRLFLPKEGMTVHKKLESRAKVLKLADMVKDPKGEYRLMFVGRGYDGMAGLSMQSVMLVPMAAGGIDRTRPAVMLDPRTGRLALRPIILPPEGTRTTMTQGGKPSAPPSRPVKRAPKNAVTGRLAPVPSGRPQTGIATLASQAPLPSRASPPPEDPLP